MPQDSEICYRRHPIRPVTIQLVHFTEAVSCHRSNFFLSSEASHPHTILAVHKGRGTLWLVSRLLQERRSYAIGRSSGDREIWWIVTQYYPTKSRLVNRVVLQTLAVTVFGRITHAGRALSTCPARIYHACVSWGDVTAGLSSTFNLFLFQKCEYCWVGLQRVASDGETYERGHYSIITLAAPVLC